MADWATGMGTVLRCDDFKRMQAWMARLHQEHPKGYKPAEQAREEGDSSAHGQQVEYPASNAVKGPPVVQVQVIYQIQTPQRFLVAERGGLGGQI